MYLVCYIASCLYWSSPFILWKTVTCLKCENFWEKNELPQGHLQVDVKVIIHACMRTPHTFSGFNLTNDL